MNWIRKSQIALLRQDTIGGCFGWKGLVGGLFPIVYTVSGLALSLLKSGGYSGKRFFGK